MKLKPGIDYIGVTTPFYCIDGKGKILLAKRSKNARDEHGTWDPGGGQVEFAEELNKSVLREVLEEYGCKGEIVQQIQAHSVIRIINGVKTHWVAVPFVVLVDPKKVKLMEPDKFDDFGWFTLSSLPKPLHSGFEKHIIKGDKLRILEKYVKE